MIRTIILFRLALRNVRRQARRSVLTGTAMVLGVGVLVLSRSLADGAHEDWIDAGVRLGSGHLSFQTPEFQRSREIADRLSGPARERAEAALGAPDVTPHVMAIAPRIEVAGLASSPASAMPVAILGVDPEAEARFTLLVDKLSAGRYLKPGDRLQAFVGSGLAERLNLRLNSRFVLTAQDANGDIVGQLVRVVGIFRMGLPEADDGLIHIPLRTAQEWLGAGTDITTLAVMLSSSRVVERVAGRLEENLVDVGGVDVVGWRTAMPTLDSAVRIDDYGDYVFHIILLAIAALAIVNTILMSILHRVREFGVVRALGLTRGQTGQLVFLEGVILTVVSGGIGVVLGLAVTWGFFRNGLDLSFLLERDFTFSGVVLEPVMVPTFRFLTVLQSLMFVVIIGFVASIYPSYRATRIDVAESMKFEA